VVILAEKKGLAVLQLEDVLAARVALSGIEPRTIIEDVAVLQNLDKRGAFMRGGMPQRVLEVLLEHIDGARNKRGLRADGKRNWIERAVERTKWRRLGFLVEFGCWRILAFRQAIDAVIEEQNFQADVSPEHVNRVIAADGERIAIPGRDPDFEVWPDSLNTCSDGGRAAVNRVKAERVHVIGE